MSTQGIRHIRNHIVVGTDGSEAARHAVAWAAREAAIRHLPLRVVHGLVWPQAYAPMAPVYQDPGDGLREAAEQFVAEAAQVARSTVPQLDVETEVVEASGTVALLEAGQDAALIVVGTRGLGGFSGLVVGSTATQLAVYAPCPVIVVREGQPTAAEQLVREPEPTDGPRPVVVGVDASDHALAALEFAYEEATLRNAALLAVHAWTGPVSTGPGDMAPLVYDPVELHADETRLLSELLAGWSDKFPDVRVTREVVRDRPDHALVEASKRADLVVVGARGVGGFRGLLFGSVSQAVLHHAQCPVAVVRA